MSEIISIVNAKGGTGKTTTTFNLGAAIANKEKRVLLIDNDSQASLTNQLRRLIRITYLIEPLLDAVDERRLNQMCGVAISYYDAETQKLFLERLNAEDWQLTVATMQRIKKACPPPHVSAAVLGKAWNLIDAERLQHSKPKTISFNRKKFAPYLSKVSSDQELEALFLEFLKAKYS